MSGPEFSSQFDIYANNIASNQAPGWNEEEKSVFLTKSQEQLCLSLYSGRNAYGSSFDSTEEMKRALANIIGEAELTPVAKDVPIATSSNSTFFELPEKLWFITYESITVSDGKCGNTNIEVVPVKQDEYHKIRKNPFRGANSRRALRLDSFNGIVEIISTHDITKYYLKYLRKPYPIILEEFSDFSINGKNKPLSETKVCELDESLHQVILENAVKMALEVWTTRQ
jgi:hypothetical protein